MEFDFYSTHSKASLLPHSRKQNYKFSKQMEVTAIQQVKNGIQKTEQCYRAHQQQKHPFP